MILEVTYTGHWYKKEKERKSGDIEKEVKGGTEKEGRDFQRETLSLGRQIKVALTWKQWVFPELG